MWSGWAGVDRERTAGDPPWATNSGRAGPTGSAPPRSPLPRAGVNRKDVARVAAPADSSRATTGAPPSGVDARVGRRTGAGESGTLVLATPDGVRIDANLCTRGAVSDMLACLLGSSGSAKAATESRTSIVGHIRLSPPSRMSPACLSAEVHVPSSDDPASGRAESGKAAFEIATSRGVVPGGPPVAGVKRSIGERGCPEPCGNRDGSPVRDAIAVCVAEGSGPPVAGLATAARCTESGPPGLALTARLRESDEGTGDGTARDEGPLAVLPGDPAVGGRVRAARWGSPVLRWTAGPASGMPERVTLEPGLPIASVVTPAGADEEVAAPDGADEEVAAPEGADEEILARAVVEAEVATGTGSGAVGVPVASFRDAADSDPNAVAGTVGLWLPLVHADGSSPRRGANCTLLKRVPICNSGGGGQGAVPASLVSPDPAPGPEGSALPSGALGVSPAGRDPGRVSAAPVSPVRASSARLAKVAVTDVAVGEVGGADSLAACVTGSESDSAACGVAAPGRPTAASERSPAEPDWAARSASTICS